jgi:hypothetical protein
VGSVKCQVKKTQWQALRVFQLQTSHFKLPTDYPAAGPCETKPIRRRIVRNEPNFPRAPGNGRGRPGPEAPPGSDYAKRTQFPAVEMSHHSNIPLFQRSNPIPIVRNKANWPPGNRRRRYPTIPSIPSFHHSNPLPVVRNKANCVWRPLELAGGVGYHSCPSNQSYRS